MATSEQTLRELERMGLSRFDAKKVAEKSTKVSEVIRTFAPEYAPFDYQADFMDDYTTRYRIYKKPRQIGCSHMAAQGEMALCVAIPKHRALLTSMNLDDAQEKIEYAWTLYEALRDTMPVPGVKSKSTMAIKLDTGSEIRAVYNPRGKAGAHLVVDEFAHYLEPKKIWQATLPIMVHDRSRLIVMSTPLHSLTFYEDIWSGRGDKYKHFARKELYWWDCPTHCRDIKAARDEAFAVDEQGNRHRRYDTEEMLERFGSPTIIEIFDSMPLDQFETEFELKDMDDDTAFLPMDLILMCTPVGESALTRFNTVQELAERTEGQSLFGGFDVGRVKDAAELTVMVERNDGYLEECYIDVFKNTPFDDQIEACDAVLSLPNMMRFDIDQTGMGMPLAENLEKKWGPRINKVHFSGPQASFMANNLKLYMQKGNVSFLWDRSRNGQMHAIKKTITAGGVGVRYGAAQGKHGGDYRNHGDAFWSRALALYGHADVKKLGKARILAL